MKRFLLVLSAVLALYSNLNAQNLTFEKVALPEKSSVYYLYCMQKNGYLIIYQYNENSYYSIYLSTNYGLSWEIPKPKINFYDGSFFLCAYDRFYVSGVDSIIGDSNSYDSSVIYTDDYCKTWKKFNDLSYNVLYTPIQSYRNEDIYFQFNNMIIRYNFISAQEDTVLNLDSNHGFFLVNPFNNNYYSIFYKKLSMKFLLSKNYGAKWDTVNVKTPLGRNWDFIGEDDIYMYSIGQVFHSSDGGNYWESIYEADLEDDIIDLEFWGTNMVFAKEKSIVYSKEPYTDFKETDLSSLVKKEINYIKISKDGHLFVIADDSSLYSADLKLAGLTVGAGTPGGSEKLCSLSFTGNKAVIETTGSIIGKINISDICGRVVYEESGRGARSEIELGSLQAGVYFISVVSPNGLIQAEKFVVY